MRHMLLLLFLPLLPFFLQSLCFFSRKMVLLILSDLFIATGALICSVLWKATRSSVKGSDCKINTVTRPLWRCTSPTLGFWLSLDTDYWSEVCGVSNCCMFHWEQLGSSFQVEENIKLELLFIFFQPIMHKHSTLVPHLLRRSWRLHNNISENM